MVSLPQIHHSSVNVLSLWVQCTWPITAMDKHTNIGFTKAKHNLENTFLPSSHSLTRLLYLGLYLGMKTLFPSVNPAKQACKALFHHLVIDKGALKISSLFLT